MRRSASEIIRSLEARIARLEKQSSRSLGLSDLAQFIAEEFSRTYESKLRNSQDVEMTLHDFFQGFTEFFDSEDEWAEEDGVYDLIFDLKDYNVDSSRSMELTVIVHHVFGNKEVNFQVSLAGRRVVIKKASSSRSARLEKQSARKTYIKDEDEKKIVLVLKRKLKKVGVENFNHLLLVALRDANFSSEARNIESSLGMKMDDDIPGVFDAGVAISNKCRWDGECIARIFAQAGKKDNALINALEKAGLL